MMNESNSIKEEIDRLEEAIKSNKFGEEYAYLVNEEFYNEIKKSITEFGTDSSFKQKLKEMHKFIDNISSLISYRLLSVKALQTIYSDKNLQNYNPIFYGYNKAIIEFSGQNGFIILLMEDPFNSNNNYKTFILNIKNKKDQNKNLYKELIENKINNYEDYIKKSESKPLPSKNLNKMEKNKFFTNIQSHFEQVNSNNETKFNNLNNNKSNEALKIKIQKILIFMYYYEKDAKLKKKEFFNHIKDTFYLVNHDWINEFKNHYYYQKFCEKLNNDYYFKFKKYDKVDVQMNDIILKLKDMTFDTLMLSEDLSNVEKIKPPLEEKFKVKYYKISFLIPSKIMNLIKNLFTNKEQLFKSTEIFSQNDDMYIIESNNIYVGNLNDELLFIPKYIFSYNSIDLIGEEKEKLKSNSLEDYIEINKLNHLLSDREQQLKNQNNEIIGKLIILNNESIKDKTKIFDNIKYKDQKNYETYSGNGNISERIPYNIKKNYNIDYINNEIEIKIKNIIKEEKEKIIIQLKNEINELKIDNNKKIEEIRKQLREEMNNEIINENKKLKEELNTAKNQIEQLKEENDKNKKENYENKKEIDKNKKEIENKKILINENEKKFDYLFNYINKLNDKIMEHDKLYNEFKKDIEKIKEENKNENNNKNIIYGKEKQEINELGITMKNIDNIFYPNKIKYNNQNNIDLRNVIPLPSFNEKYSKFNLGGNSNDSQNKIYQNPNPEIIDENDKKICYLNIILKCLSQILDSDFLKEQTKSRIRDNNQFQLSNGFLAYAQNFGNKYSKENNSSSILKIIQNTNNNLENNYNLKNIISTIFDQLNKELKIEIEPVNIDKISFESNREKDFFLRKFEKETSIISYKFTGFIEKKIQCIYSNINKPNYEFKKYNYLIFEIQKYKNKYNITNNEIKLKECFNYYRKEGIFREEKKSECEICNEMCQKNFISDYFINPNFLILILDRGNENLNEDIKVKFEEKLTLKSKSSEDNYNLYAVITQIGKDRQNIVASYKRNKDNKDNNWYRYNNQDEKLINNIQKEVIDFEHPLLLLYKKNKNYFKFIKIKY